MKSRISSKGQVTVPVDVRRALGLAPGMPVEFMVREGEAVMRKGRVGTHPVDALYGKLELARPVDEVLDEMRGPRPKEGTSRTPTRRRTARPRR